MAFRLPSDDNPLQRIVKGIAAFYGTSLPEKAYLHLDRSFYASGETLWFKAYVVEADSHTWHSSRSALRRDCRRYSELVVRGWLVVRFAWEDVMFDPDFVRGILIGLAAQRAHRPRNRPRAA